MAIVQTDKTYGGKSFVYTVSDAGYLIRQTETGKLFTDALDIADAEYTYTETDVPADPDAVPAPEPTPIDPDTELYAQAGRILLGA